jgi:hypothetical protein
VIEISDESSDVTIEETVVTNAGRNDKKAKWAFLLYTPRPAVDKDGNAMWKWSCNYCSLVHTVSCIISTHELVSRIFRCSPRTPGCTKYKDETLKRPSSSNFISHADKCTQVPRDRRWAVVSAAGDARTKGGVVMGVATEGDLEDPSGSVGGLEAQRSFMDAFSARGLANPAKTVTRKGFREHLVKGIIEDDLPYSFGEKAGMKKLFVYLLPSSIKPPSHQTVRHDLDLLYTVLDDKVNEELRVSFYLMTMMTRVYIVLHR